MFWIFLGILIIVLFFCVMRQLFVKPIMKVIKNATSEIANMAMQIAMLGDNYWKKDVVIQEVNWELEKML